MGTQGYTANVCFLFRARVNGASNLNNFSQDAILQGLLGAFWKVQTSITYIGILENPRYNAQSERVNFSNSFLIHRWIVLHYDEDVVIAGVSVAPDPAPIQVQYRHQLAHFFCKIYYLDPFLGGVTLSR